MPDSAAREMAKLRAAAQQADLSATSIAQANGHAYELTGLIPVSKSNPAPANCEANAIRIVEVLPRFANIFFDTFDHHLKVEEQGQVRPWQDEDDTRAVAYIQEYIAPRITRDVLRCAIHVVARDRSRDSLGLFVETLPPWDGTARIERFFQDCVAAVDTEHVRCAGRNLFVAMIARALVPGCEVHHATILEGAQGIGKNALFKALGGPFYVESRRAIDSTDFLRTLRGSWLVHMGELGAIRRADVELLKDRISANADEFVEKYERNPRRYLRRCVIVGSTNKFEYLSDETGNRRLVPVRCGDGPVRVDLVESSRLQLFAEALVLFRSGQPWHRWSAGTNNEQSARMMEDPWQKKVVAYLEERENEDVTIWAVLDNAIELETSRMDKSAEQRARSILVCQGWESIGRSRIAGMGQVRIYRKKKPVDNSDT